MLRAVTALERDCSRPPRHGPEGTVGGQFRWELRTRQSLVKDIFGPSQQQHEPLYVNNRTPIQ
jgi:hypothetical protein